MLDDVDRRALYLSEGLGHAFLALTDDANVTYLCSEPYAPGREHGVHPLDPALDLRRAARLAGRPRAAAVGQGRRRADARRGAGAGLLPSYEAVPGLLPASLRGGQ